MTNGAVLIKIKKDLKGIFDILANEYPTITPNNVAKVADMEAIFILI